MLGLRSLRRPATATAPRRFAQPSLESLERRYVPTPILTISVKYETGRQVLLAGDLTGVEDVSDVTISLSGKVSGTAKTNEDGVYSVRLTATGLGMVHAVAAGSGASAEEELFDVTPILTSFSASEGANGAWTFSGTVMYRRMFDSLTINFGGAPLNLQGGTTTTDSDGSFEWVVTLNGTSSDNGLTWAQAVTPWGTTSERLYDNIYQTGT